MNVTYPTTSQPGRLRVLRAIFENGPMTRRDVMRMAGAEAGAQHHVLDDMQADGQLFEQGGLLAIHEDLCARLTQDDDDAPAAASVASASADLVPPPYVREFRPLDPKHIPSARGPRDTEPAREFHPKTLAGSMAVMTFYD